MEGAKGSDKPRSPDPIYVLRSIKSPVTDLNIALLSNMQVIFCGRFDGQIELWNLESKRVMSSIDGHGCSSVNAIGYLYAEYFYSHGRDGKVNVWNLCGGGIDKVSSFASELTNFCKASTFSDACDLTSGFILDNLNIIKSCCNEIKNWIALPGPDSEITIKNIWNGENVHKLNISNDGGLGMCMYSKCIVNEHYGRPYIMAGYECGDIILWDVAERKPLCQNKCFNEPVTCLDLTSTYAHGLVGSVERAITTVEINNMETLDVKRSAITIKNSGLNDIKIRPDNKLVATAGWDGRIRLFSMKSLKALAVLTYHTESISKLAFSYNNAIGSKQLLVAGSRDGRISLWSIYN
ncbi:Guanine nucleotide-binding protein subunit beta-like protein 1 [Trichoplax sp. H2]|nr:Guanine nucleotide-binding protein subunit beta-like protein 1 [Trichoplax sp. H2]|eukprot:RDD47326.1 Guanine nucleotide-binding protein subunit beta-like protein 1 [Trichoplax sp. H2]